MKKVAITGSLACGKSTVCRYLKNLGAYCVNADDIVHQLLTPETHIGKKVIAYLGPDSVKEGKIDRSYIAKLVFADPNKLRNLENIIHPAVLEEIKKEYEKAKKNPTCRVFVSEIPLLFECAWESCFDVIVTVSAQEELCRKRAQNISPSFGRDFDHRMKRQMPLSEKIKRSTLTIVNNGSLKELETQVLELYRTLL